MHPASAAIHCHPISNEMRWNAYHVSLQAEQIKDVNIIGIYKSVLSSDGATHERMFTPYPMEDAVPKVRQTFDVWV